MLVSYYSFGLKSNIVLCTYINASTKKKILQPMTSYLNAKAFWTTANELTCGSLNLATDLNLRYRKLALTTRW